MNTKYFILSLLCATTVCVNAMENNKKRPLYDADEMHDGEMQSTINYFKILSVSKKSKTQHDENNKPQDVASLLKHPNFHYIVNSLQASPTFPNFLQLIKTREEICNELKNHKTERISLASQDFYRNEKEIKESVKKSKALTQQYNEIENLIKDHIKKLPILDGDVIDFNLVSKALAIYLLM